jgi:hypothetical protein
MNYFKEYETLKEIHIDLSGNESRYNSKGFLIYRKYPSGSEFWFDEGNLYRARFQNGTEVYYNEDGNITKVIAPNPQNLS